MKRMFWYKRLFFLSFLILMVGAFWAISSVAAPTQGPAGMAFYEKPSTIPGTHGTLIRYRTSTSVPPGGTDVEVR